MDLKTRLSEYYTFISENNRHITFRCTFCGDSSNTKHGHLNVDKTKPVFRCVRCGASGHVYLLFKLANLEIPSDLSSFKNKELHTVLKLKASETYEDYIVEYFKNRLNIEPDKKFNILSLKDFNDIIKNFEYTVTNNRVIPFFTHKGKRIICRFTESTESGLRYYAYPLIEGSDYYIINAIDDNIYIPSYKKTIIIGEGIFDIINTYVNNYVEVSGVYIAAISKDFKRALQYVRGLTFCYKPNIILLADNDTSNDDYMYTFSGESSFDYASLKIYRNKRGKDFGEKNVDPFIAFVA